MTTYTVEGRIETVVTMNVCAENSKEALKQAEVYLENGAYEKHQTEKRLVAIA